MQDRRGCKKDDLEVLSSDLDVYLIQPTVSVCKDISQRFANRRKQDQGLTSSICDRDITRSRERFLVREGQVSRLGSKLQDSKSRPLFQCLKT